MNDYHQQIAILFNEDGQISKGDPQDLLAVQYTATAARHLHEALTSLGYPVTKIAIRGNLEELEDTLCSFSPKSTFIFNNCDGFNGNNMGAAEVLRVVERLGFKHTGATAEAMTLCTDKSCCKERLLQRGVPTPRYQTFERAEGEFHLQFPVIVKPAVEDASMGIDFGSVICDIDGLYQRIAYITDLYAEPAVVEEFVPGRELHVSMLGNKPIECLPISEDDYSLIADPLQHMLTYEAKWKTDSFYFQNIASRVPASLTRKEEQVVRKAAEGSFRAMGLRDLGRVDMRFHNGIPYVIDINELPDLSPDAGFWNSARAAGWSYPQMVERILTEAMKREGWME
jgi:D-alanine-D-alanine ligase